MVSQVIRLEAALEAKRAMKKVRLREFQTTVRECVRPEAGWEPTLEAKRAMKKDQE